MPKRGLGRGLEAILGAAAGDTEELRELAVGDLYPNPYQPRSGFDQDKLEELAASIRAHGVVQPVLVRPFGDRFELVAGERRWRAARMAGLATVPAMVRPLSDRQSLEIALIENLQREDLTALEEARAYQAMMSVMNFTQEQVSERLGISRPAVSNALRLLSLADEIQELLRGDGLTAGHARTLVGLDDAEQIRLAGMMVRDGLNVRQAEELVRSAVAGSTATVAKKRRQRPRDPDVLLLEQQLRQALGTEVSVTRTGNGGRVVIRYFSLEELERLLDRLLGEGRE